MTSPLPHFLDDIYVSQWLSNMDERIVRYFIQGSHKLWKAWKTWKITKKVPCMEKSWNLKKPE